MHVGGISMPQHPIAFDWYSSCYSILQILQKIFYSVKMSKVKMTLKWYIRPRHAEQTECYEGNDHRVTVVDSCFFLSSRNLSPMAHWNEDTKNLKIKVNL